MSLTASDLARLGPAAQKQVVEKVLAQKTGKYHNRKTVRHGITFDSKHEAYRFRLIQRETGLNPRNFYDLEKLLAMIDTQGS